MIPFHLAFPVHDLVAARAFYVGVLGCREGRSSEDSATFDLHGHQLVAHLAADEAAHNAKLHVMGDDDVPPRHFGLVFDWEEWPRQVTKLRMAGVKFLVEPELHDKGPGGEQATCFFADPSGNVLEFKAFRDPARMFERVTSAGGRSSG